MNKEEGSGTAEIPYGLRRNWDPTLQERKFVRICFSWCRFYKKQHSSPETDPTYENRFRSCSFMAEWKSCTTKGKHCLALSCLFMPCCATSCHTVLSCAFACHYLWQRRKDYTDEETLVFPRSSEYLAALLCPSKSHLLLYKLFCFYLNPALPEPPLYPGATQSFLLPAGHD